jgi:TPR repeat protein
MKKFFISLSAILLLFVSGCSSKPVNFYTGEGETLTQLEKSCNSNDAKRCVNLGAEYFYGVSVRRDIEKAEKYFSKACNMNLGAGCYNLGTINKYRWIKTRYDGYREMANKYFAKGCALGDVGKCNENSRWYDGETGRHLSSIVLVYDKAPSDVTKLGKDCASKNSSACYKLGLLYTSGNKGVRKDDLKAIKYHNMACDLNNAKGCAALGSLYKSIKKDNLKSKKYYHKACQLGNPSACYLYQLMSNGRRHNPFKLL